MNPIHLPHEYALVLQQVHENGEEDFAGLADSLRLTPGRLAHVLQDLAHKRLIISRNAGYGIWVRLSARGKRLIHSMWPEAVPA
jgi:hypothetical protein